MKRTLRFMPLALSLAAASAAHAELPPAFDAYLAAAPAATPAASARTPSGNATGFVASIDELRGVPTFFWAAPAKQALPPSLANAGPERRARAYLEQNARTYGLSRAALRTAHVKHVHDTGRGGVIVTFGQRVAKVGVFETEIKILLDRAGDLVAIGGNLHASATGGNKDGRHSFKIDASEAIAGAFDDLYGVTITPQDLRDLRREANGYRHFDLKSTPKIARGRLVFNHPARAKKVFYPMPDHLRPAYYLELDVRQGGSKTSDVFGYVIAADTGELLVRRNLTQDLAFNYRVWAQPAAPSTPLEGPHVNYTPHPTGLPDGSVPAFVAPIMISMEGFNSPGGGAADPWLAAAATQTSGNNCDAYADISAGDGFTAGDIRATTTAANTFDRVYDTALAPAASNNQIMASVTQIFYDINWLHDYYYDSGFDEASGNAQVSNFSRGGAQGDPLLAEAQDYSGTDNANMTTPADGASPRMQMYIWGGDTQTSLNVQPLNLSPLHQSAGFGPTAFNTTAGLVLGKDGNAVNGGNPDLADGCQNQVINVAGKIVLLNRGDCSFEEKVQRAQNAGAVGVLITDNVTPGLPPMGDDNTIPANVVTIGSFGISQADGDTLKAALLNGPLDVTMARTTFANRDGTIDNGIVAHEWGHYIHHRLVACSTEQCSGESEGWGDFISMMLAIDAGENIATGTFAAAIYSTASLGDEGYFGIRRFPYSRDTTKNGLTFKHVTNGVALPPGPTQAAAPDNWEVHNSGEIWTQMLFQAYTGLILNGGHTFAEAKRRMADYIVAGMKMAPVNPTFTEQRDGILAAAAAADPDDFVLLAQGFADRGAGTCAVSPAKASADGSGVVEDFTLSGRQSFVSIAADDSIVTCDADGVLDAQETGKLKIEVLNSGAGTLTSTSVTVTTGAAGVTFPNGNMAVIPSIPPFGVGTAFVNVALGNGFTGITDIDFTAAITNAGACAPDVQATASLRVNYDDTPQSATVETVESPASPWTKWSGPGFAGLADDVWSRNKQANGNYRWYGQDFPSHSDTAIESPDLVVSANQNLVVTFDHAYDFEASQQMGQWTYWDGALVEISQDGGQTWQDVSMFGAPGYNGTIAAIAGADNPLGGRAGYVRRNAAWPGTNTVTLNLGNTFATKTVRIRFRVGTDALEGVPTYQGWYVDNISVQGITNTPFPTVVGDPPGCNTPPVAGAGPDQVVDEGTSVMLDASMSSDADSDPLTFAWSQTVGPNVMLSNPAIATPSFTAPQVAADTMLTFQVDVGDGLASANDTVNVLVLDVPVGSTGSGAGGMGTGGAGGMGTGGAGGMGTGGAGGMGTGGAGGTGTGTGGAGGAGTGGEGGSGGAGGSDEVDVGGGCNCEAAGSSGAPGGGWFAPMLAAVAVLLRRRKAAART